MKIDVIPYASAIKTEGVKNKNVVVIDVLRASSVMVTALNNGAKSVIPVLNVDDAFRLAKKMPEKSYLLSGERNTKLIPGFDLGNSPLEHTREKVADKTIILSTSNGTKALHALDSANHVYIGTFLNSAALIDKLLSLNEIILVCSGTNDNFSMDDGMFAAHVISQITKQKEASLSDLAQTLLKAYQSENGNLNILLQDCYHLNLLKRNGFEQDVNYCLQTDKLSLVPEKIKNNIEIVNRNVQITS
ncbi:MAG: 2-phosphosulfolactate phosphatase [Bacteroidales bacterium]|nr:2-phosphosulfolactate phosphatase [Bacteroidales bacterium]